MQMCAEGRRLAFPKARRLKVVYWQENGTNKAVRGYSLADK